MKGIFAFCLVLIASCLSLWFGHAEDGRPNVILIMADDMGYECVRANGGDSYVTPHLDAMAAGGVRFTNCYSQPLCTPSRVQIMTGRYNYHNYVRFGYLDPKEKTFGNSLKEAGYATCIVGKWQLTYGEEALDRPKHFGFDEWCLWNTPATERPRYADASIDTNGVAKSHSGEYGPDIVSGYASDFMTRNKDKPFFLYYPMILPHSPFEPTPDSPEWQTDKRKKKDNRFFKDMVTYIDTIIGRLMKQTEALGIADNTLIVFTGDNGTHRALTSTFNGSPYPGGKGRMYVPGTHVPLIAYWKGHAKVRVCEDLVDFTDVFPTLCEATGAKPSAGITLDGQSFLPQIKGVTSSPRTSVFVHYDPRWNVPEKPGRFASTANYKLYHDGRFYNIKKDFLETKPLAASPEIANVRNQLQAVLDSKPKWTPPASAKPLGGKQSSKRKREKK